MIKLTNEMIRNKVLFPSKNAISETYVVENTITLYENLNIGEHVTLIFQGGKFEKADDVQGDITIIGENTRLVAPICAIFGQHINVTGSWNIEKSYPQWFEEINENEEIVDYSLIINKAILMKKSGVVFLKSGKYKIKKNY